MKTFEHIVGTTLLTLLLLLVSVRALGQSHPQTATQKPMATEKSLLASSTSTAAHGEAETFKAPAVLNIDHSDLGALARQIRARANARLHSRFLVEQDQTGKVVKTEKAYATTDIWLYGVSE